MFFVMQFTSAEFMLTIYNVEYIVTFLLSCVCAMSTMLMATSLNFYLTDYQKSLELLVNNLNDDIFWMEPGSER